MLTEPQAVSTPHKHGDAMVVKPTSMLMYSCTMIALTQFRLLLLLLSSSLMTAAVPFKQISFAALVTTLAVCFPSILEASSKWSKMAF